MSSSILPILLHCSLGSVAYGQYRNELVWKLPNYCQLYSREEFSVKMIAVAIGKITAWTCMHACMNVQAGAVLMPLGMFLLHSKKY